MKVHFTKAMDFTGLLLSEPSLGNLPELLYKIPLNYPNLPQTLKCHTMSFETVGTLLVSFTQTLSHNLQGTDERQKAFHAAPWHYWSLSASKWRHCQSEGSSQVWCPHQTRHCHFAVSFSFGFLPLTLSSQPLLSFAFCFGSLPLWPKQVFKLTWPFSTHSTCCTALALHLL